MKAFKLGFIVIFSMPFIAASEPLGEKMNGFTEAMQTLRAKHNIPGLSAAVVEDDSVIWQQSYGYADGNRVVPVTADTPFWIASITKTFVGLALLHLEQNEGLDLDRIANKTPDFNGLCEWLESTTIPFAYGLDCKQPITIRHILHHQVNQPLGSQFMYNPIMYSRLSRHLEYLYGRGVKDVKGRHNYLGQTIDKYIVEPAGMKRTMSSMWDDTKLRVFYDLADGFNVDEKGYKSKAQRPDKHIAGGAGVVSTVNDLIKYDIALRSGVIASGTVKKALMAPATFEDGSVSPYGFGWYFQEYKGEQLMWHSGWDPDAGYSALLLRVPKRQMTFIVLANSEGLWWGNPLDKAQVENSDFAQAFFEAFL